MATLSEKEFGRLLVENRESLFRVAMKLCRDSWARVQDAEDLVSDTMVKGLRNRSRFEAGTDILKWLLQILRHTYYDMKKYRSSRQHEDLDVIQRKLEFGGNGDPEMVGLRGALNDHGPNPFSALLTAETMEIVGRGLGRMNPDQRGALLMFSEGYRYDEIADAQGSPVMTICSRVSRARGIMRKVLEAESIGREDLAA